jgi:hypothetical protein
VADKLIWTAQGNAARPPALEIPIVLVDRKIHVANENCYHLHDCMIMDGMQQESALRIVLHDKFEQGRGNQESIIRHAALSRIDAHRLTTQSSPQHNPHTCNLAFPPAALKNSGTIGEVPDQGDWRKHKKAIRFQNNQPSLENPSASHYATASRHLRFIFKRITSCPDGNLTLIWLGAKGMGILFVPVYQAMFKI